MPYEMFITYAHNLTEDVIGFGEHKDIAERVFNQAWQGLLMDGYRSQHNTEKPNFVEVLHKDGKHYMYIELRYRQQWDLGNMLRLIHLLAMDATYGKYLATGLAQGSVVAAERAWIDPHYVMHVVEPNGLKLRYALPTDRTDAIKAFNEKVREREANGQTIVRCPDADMKWMAMDISGATTLEFVEVSK